MAAAILGSLLFALVLQIVVVSIPIEAERFIGDWDEIENLKSPEVVMLAKFALKEHGKKANTTTLKFEYVIQGLQRISMIYRLMISAKDNRHGNSTKTYVAMIHYRPWIKKGSTRLMSFREIQGYKKGWWPVDDLKDRWVLMSAKFAVTEQNKKANTSLRFVKVVQGEERPYGQAKYDYNLVISAKDKDNSSNARPSNYQVSVSFMLNIIKLLSFKKI